MIVINSKKLVYFLVVSLICGLVVGEAAHAQIVGITGKIHADGTPVAGAIVTAPGFGNLQQVAVTNENGNYSLPYISFANAVIRAGDEISIEVTDAAGNVIERTHTVNRADIDAGEATFDINVNVSIPDPNLRARVEEFLDKASGATITLWDMATLTYFVARFLNISDLTGLESATNLTELSLGHNNITDITPLAGLTNLTELRLEANSISDVSVVSVLTHLTFLTLRANSISDISAISVLTNLTDLNISDNSVSDISAVSDLTNLTWLAIGSNNVSDISAVSGLTNLTWLHLSNSNVSDISVLKGLTNLTVLHLHSNTISDISPLVSNTGLGQGDYVGVTQNTLSAVSINTHIPTLQQRGVEVQFDAVVAQTVNIPDPNLRAKIETALGKASGAPITTADMAALGSLDATNANISDLTGLEHATNLTNLFLWENNISDISPLSGLTNLTEIKIGHNMISDISAVSGLTNLTFLGIRDNQIVDISAVSRLTKLKWLLLDINKISDLSPLVSNRGLGSGDTVDVRGNPLNTVSVNTHIPTLQRRGVTVEFDAVVAQTVNIPDPNLRAKIEAALGKASGAPITTADMAALGSLGAPNDNIKDLSGLEHATNLTGLDLGGEWVEVRWIYSNTISDISPLAGLTNLTELSLSYNTISNLSPLAGLTNLTRLYLYGNRISDISPLDELTNLTYLELSGNRILDISPLAGLTNLTTLRIWRNNISDISAVSDLTNLTYLVLYDNNISNISAVSGLTNLTYLSLRGNSISDISPLVSNTGLGEGDRVRVRGNPLNAVSINTHIPTLQGRGVEVEFDAVSVAVNIPDPNLRAKIEQALGKGSGATITTADMATLTQLDAPNANISNLTGLEHATNLTELALDNNGISNLSPLVSNTGLGEDDKINVRGNPLNAASINTHIPTLQRRGVEVLFDAVVAQTVNIPDPNLRAKIEAALGKGSGATITTADMATLTELDAPNANISDLTGLEYATNLTRLDLDENYVSGQGWVNSNSVSDLSPLSGLTNLTSLVLGGNSISDISAVSGLTNLTYLSLRGNSISDISAVSDLTNLASLSLNRNNLSDISPLSGLTNLTSLGLKGNSISDISAVSGLTNLTSLGLNGNSISDISAVSGLTKLISLYAGGNSISNISALAGLTNLRDLGLSLNSISDLSSLVGLTNLATLTLRYNNISDISAVSGLTKLISLYAGGNSISNISALAGLTNLRDLGLEGNSISDLSSLVGLTNLATLTLRYNNISDISAVSGLTKLISLYAGGNSISNISALAGLTNLRDLWLNGNSVSDISPLVSNTGLGEDDRVYVRGNPLNAVSLNTHIPTLQRKGVEVRFDAPTPVNIPDRNLRAAIKKALGKVPDDTITTADMATLTQLDAPNANISNLTGLEHAINLTELSLDNNRISDLSPLVSNTGLGDEDKVNVRGNPLNAVSVNTHIPTLQSRGVEVQFTVKQPPIVSQLRHPFIYWTGWSTYTSKIQRANLDGSNVQDLVTQGVRYPSGIALDVVGGKMYWTDNGTDKIQRANLDGSNVQDLVTQGVEYPLGIALDVVDGKMYWTDKGVWTDARAGKIQCANLDGSNVQDLVSGLEFPFDLALDVADGKMYWTDARAGKIQCANLDGSNVQDLVTGLGDPLGIALDVGSGKMYWTDGGNSTSKIQRANLDGSNVQDLITRTQGVGRPDDLALDVVGGKMYWIDAIGLKIRCANLDGSNVQDLVTQGVQHSGGIAIGVPSQLIATAQTVNIPDANLRAKIEAALGKASGAPITTADMATLTRLDAQNANIRALTGLEHATNLTELDLGAEYVEGEGYINSNSVSDLSPLTRLMNLTWLRLRHNSISNISPLAGLTNLTWLNLGGNTISNISPLSGLTNLTTLWLYENPLSDISALAGLTNLTELYLYENNILDISALSGLTNLTELNLNINNISDISPLSGLTNLTWLALFNNSISDISAVSGLTNLTFLDLVSNSISDISAVSGLTNLTVLGLSLNSISDISAVSGLTNLADLRLARNSISDISPLAGLTNLTTLRIWRNNISDISAVSDLTNLTYLVLYDNNISNISAVSGLTNLTYLSLRGNSISDISPLVSNTGLGEGDRVRVRGNPLNAVSINTHIPTLQGRGVEVEFDAVSVAVNIPDPNLRAMVEAALGKAAGTPLTADDMATLTRLDAPNADIKDLTGLEHATNLTELSLDNNDISDLSPLVSNTGLGDGDKVNVKGNPLSSVSINTHISALQGRGVEVQFDSQPPPPQSVSVLSVEGIVYKADGTTPVDGVTATVTVGSNPPQMATTDTAGNYSVAFFDIGNIVASTGDTVSIEVTDTEGNVTEETHTVTAADISAGKATFNITLVSTTVLSYTSMIPAGTSLFHVPLEVEGLETVGDLKTMLGDTVSLAIVYDDATGSWNSRSDDVMITADLGIILSTTAAISYTFEGQPWGGGTSTVSLQAGDNLIGLPVDDPRVENISDIIGLFASGVVANVAVSTADGFPAVAAAGDANDGPVMGDAAYLVTAAANATATLIGKGWSNNATGAAPIGLVSYNLNDQTPVLDVHGAVVDEITGLAREGFRVKVKNLSTKAALNKITSVEMAEGGYNMTFVDLTDGHAARVGDVLEISADSPSPLIGVKPVRHIVTIDDVKSSRVWLAALIAYEIPAETELLTNYPNPFNPETWIPYRLAEDAFVTLTIYDLTGQVVRTLEVGHRIAAVYESRSKAIYWDGRNEFGESVASGVYFYQLQAGSESFLRKMVILK